MIRLPILVSIMVAGWALLTSGCTDRPPLTEPASVGSAPYVLGAGDKLRIVVYDQPNLTNLYEIDASGRVSIPLIGDIKASGVTAEDLAKRVEAKLASGYLKEPNVTVEVATY